MKDWLKTVDNCAYKYAYDESGIAIDIVNRSVILIQHINRRPVMKTYPFNLIRKWSYEIPSPEVIQTIGNVGIGPSLQVAAKNYMSAKNAQSNTGLKIQVKDIDYPEWFIRFASTNTVSTDLKRWMEIFTQYINDETPQTGKFCPACGAKVIEGNKFCTGCGTNINKS